jgi:hypothetical protein
MGTTCCITISDCIAIAGILVDTVVAIWIVKTIQNKLTNRRVLKDLIIKDIIEIKKEYNDFLIEIDNDRILPKEVVPKLKSLSLKINNMMGLIPQSYKIQKNKLEPYQKELNMLITNDKDYSNSYKENKTVKFSNKTQFIEFQQKYSYLFNDLIVEVNEA